MDPTTPSRPVKDGNWEFPDNISFPVYVRVMLKMFKVAEGDQDGQTIFVQYTSGRLNLYRYSLFNFAWV